MGAKSRRDGVKIRLRDVSEATGISIQVLSNISSPTNPAATNTTFVEALCRYFNCGVDELIELSPPEMKDGQMVCHVREIRGKRDSRGEEE